MTKIIALIVGLPLMVVLAACAASNQQDIDAAVEATVAQQADDCGFWAEPEGTIVAENDDTIDGVTIGNALDFDVTVNIYNPESDFFSFGFDFRAAIGTSREYLVVKVKDGVTYLDQITRLESPDKTIFGLRKEVLGYYLGVGEQNTIRLIADGDEGHVYINGMQVANLDLSHTPKRTTYIFLINGLWTGTGGIDLHYDSLNLTCLN